jgi:hypothetical protein
MQNPSCGDDPALFKSLLSPSPSAMRLKTKPPVAMICHLPTRPLCRKVQFSMRVHNFRCAHAAKDSVVPSQPEPPHSNCHPQIQTLTRTGLWWQASSIDFGPRYFPCTQRKGARDRMSARPSRSRRKTLPQQTDSAPFELRRIPHDLSAEFGAQSSREIPNCLFQAQHGSKAVTKLSP